MLKYGDGDGDGDEQDTWEPPHNLNCPEKLTEYLGRKAKEYGVRGYAFCHGVDDE